MESQELRPLFSLLVRRGYRVVSLQETLADAAYKEEERSVSPTDGRVVCHCTLITVGYLFTRHCCRPWDSSLHGIWMAPQRFTARCQPRYRPEDEHRSPAGDPEAETKKPGVACSDSAAAAHGSEDTCMLEDRQSCPRSMPRQLTPQEVATIRKMATDMDYLEIAEAPVAIFPLAAEPRGRPAARCLLRQLTQCRDAALGVSWADA